MRGTQQLSTPNLDPTIPAPMVNVAEYGFEGRFEEWAGQAEYFEYSKAANPVGSGHAPQVPLARFDAEMYLDAPTGVIPLDLSKELGIETGAATSPALLANFVRIHAKEQIDTNPNATSQLYYVLYGRGFAAVNGRLVQWEKGDFLTLPAGARSVFYADADAAMYWVHDEPLLRYLGAERVDERVIQHLARRLSRDDKRELWALANVAPGWARPAIEQIVSTNDPSESSELPTKAKSPTRGKRDE